RLNEPQLRQLKQRVALRCELPALDLRETAGYIASRVRVAGGNADMLFTREAVIAVHEHSRGIPRLTSVICDNALVSGFAADMKPVSRDLILEVCRDFQLDQKPSEPPASARLDVQPAAVAAAPAPAKPAAPKTEPKPMFSGLARPRRFSFF